MYQTPQHFIPNIMPITPLEDALLRLNSKRRVPETSELPNSPTPLEKALLNIWLGEI